MYTNLADHPFSAENIAAELGEYARPDERRWLRWCDEAERLLGHDLDGNDPDAFDLTKTGGDGYSIDEAYEYFSKGRTAHAYVAVVSSRERYRGRL